MHAHTNIHISIYVQAYTHGQTIETDITTHKHTLEIKMLKKTLEIKTTHPCFISSICVGLRRFINTCYNIASLPCVEVWKYHGAAKHSEQQNAFSVYLV